MHDLESRRGHIVSRANNALDERLAKGEITVENYERLKAVLNKSQATQPRTTKIIPANASLSVGDWLDQNFATYFKWVAIPIAIVVAITLKPDMASFEQILHQEILAGISQEKIEKSDDFAMSLLKFGCKLSAADCAKLIRSQTQIRAKDLFVARIVYIKTGKDEGRCIGAFSTWWC